MKIPLKEILIRMKVNEMYSVSIDDRFNCKDIHRHVTGRNALRDPILQDYMSADVVSIGVTPYGVVDIEVML